MNGAGENECDSSSVEIKRMTLLRGRQEDLKREVVLWLREGKGKREKGHGAKRTGREEKLGN